MAENHQSDRNPPPAQRSVQDLGRIAAFLLLTAAIIGFYWKLVLTNQYTWLATPDLAHQVLPWFQFQAGEWHAGRFPLWDPSGWAGQPLLGQAQPGVLYPLNWVLFSLPLRNGWLKPTHLHWYFVVIHLMAAWFAYLLAKDLRLSRWAAVFCGVVFSLSGWLGTNDWPQMLNGAVWAPLVILFLLRAVRGEGIWRSSILGGFFLGISWLSGHHQIPIFVSLAAAGVWLWTSLSQRNHRLILAAAVFFTVAGAAGAAQILPAIEYGRLSERWVSAAAPVTWNEQVPYTVHAHFSLHLPSLLGILFPGFYIHSDPNLGAVALALALLGVAMGWRRMEVRIMTGLAAGALIFSLAHHTPFHGILYSVIPGVEKARSASMSIFVFGLAMATLAAFGLQEMIERREHAWVRRAAVTLLGLGLLVMLAASAGFFYRWLAADSELRWMMTGLAALLMSALIAGYRRSSVGVAAVAAGAVGLFLVEIANTNSYMLPSLEEKDRTLNIRRLADHGDIATFLRMQPDLPRVEVDHEAIPYNFGDWYGLHEETSYLASLTLQYRIFEPHADAGRRLLGIAYRISKEPNAFYKKLVFSGKSGLNVYSNEAVMPRVFVVHEAERLENPKRMMSYLTELGEDAGKRAVMTESPPALERCEAAESLRVVHYEPSRVKIDASLACKGMLILTDTSYPGWYATVDGREAQIHEVYSLVRGVVVGSGRHIVEFRYRPRLFYVGAALGLAALLLALGTSLQATRRRLV